MWKQIMANKRLVLTAAIALVAGCALGILVGLAIRTSEPEAEQTGRIGIQAVLPTTALERRIEFAKCGHTEHIPLLNEAFIGYTQEELQAFYKTCRVTEFTREQVVIQQTLDTCCPEHVLLRARQDGTLCVFQTDSEFYIEQLIRVLPVDARADLAEEERKRLEEGIVFDTLGDVDAYLEGMES